MPGRVQVAWALVWLAAAVVSMTGCVDVDGGAVEFSWSLRTPQGQPTTCLQSGIDKVRLCWAALPEDSDRAVVCEGARTFECASERGFSRFEIDSGRTAFWIEPLCAQDLLPPDPATYEVPPPLVRRVSSGQVVTLSALLIVATDESCNDGFCTCRDQPSSP